MNLEFVLPCPAGIFQGYVPVMCCMSGCVFVSADLFAKSSKCRQLSRLKPLPQIAAGSISNCGT